MKRIIKLEELALMLLFSCIYFLFYNGSWLMFAALFFAPDLAFLFLVISKKSFTIVYNLLHHKGVMTLLMIAGYLFHHDGIIQTGLIFLAHSCFDRFAGYGLKYFDSPDHTHLGWVGKSAFRNQL